MRISMWRLWCCLGLLVVVAGCNGGKQQPGDQGSSKGTRRIMFVTNGDDPFWDALLSGLKEGSKQNKLTEAGLSAHRDVNNGSAEGQIEKLRQYATQDDIAGVAISVIQADNLAIVEEMRKLQKKGVKIITVDGDVNRNEFRDARSYYIGTDNVVGGRTLGTATKALLQTKGIKSGGYIQYAGFTDNDNARSRMNGVKEAIGDSYTEYPRLAAHAVSTLREAGVDGPYAAILGPRCWTGVIETTEYGGYPVLEHLRLILGGPVVWGPAVDGAVILSVRGDDFQLSCGEDMALGYITHDSGSVALFLEESIGFRVLTPEAAVPLRHLS